MSHKAEQHEDVDNIKRVSNTELNLSTQEHSPIYLLNQAEIWHWKYWLYDQIWWNAATEKKILLYISTLHINKWRRKRIYLTKLLLQGNLSPRVSYYQLVHFFPELIKKSALKQVHFTIAYFNKIQKWRVNHKTSCPMPTGKTFQSSSSFWPLLWQGLHYM